MGMTNCLTPAAQDGVNGRIREREDAAIDRFRGAVIPVYGATEAGRPDHIGSAVLLAVGGFKVVLTAAHVIDHNASTTLYGPARSDATGGSSLEPIEGEFRVTSAPGGDRLRDRFDFAFCRLPEGTALAGRFVGEDEIQTTPVDDSGRLYTALGYPNSKNNKHEAAKRSVTATLQPYSEMHKVDRQVAASLPDGGRHHILLPFGRRSRNRNGTTGLSFDPWGMSGGAVVDAGLPADLDALRGRPAGPPMLAGLSIEARRGTGGRRVLLATRMSLIVPVLLANLP
jgi:hypothetical protein